MQITVVGAGYVGLSLATLLGQKHEVIVLDIDEEKVAKVNSRISPVQDVYLEKFFAERKLNLTATVDTAIAYKDAEYVIITTPTNYEDETIIIHLLPVREMRSVWQWSTLIRIPI